jgi:hypothetical protein
MAVPSEIPREFKKHAKRADKQGWRFRKVKCGYQLLAPDGANSVTIHKTPSPRSIRNYVADMRKFGYKD